MKTVFVILISHHSKLDAKLAIWLRFTNTSTTTIKPPFLTNLHHEHVLVGNMTMNSNATLLWTASEESKRTHFIIVASNRGMNYHVKSLSHLRSSYSRKDLINFGKTYKHYIV